MLSSKHHLKVRVKLLGFYGENKQWKPTITMAYRENLPLIICVHMYVFGFYVVGSVCDPIEGISLFKIVFFFFSSDCMQR